MRGHHSILQKLIAYVSSRTKKLSDFNIGSAVRTLLESVSLQLEEFYYNLQQATIYAVKNSAYEAFGFYREKSKKATGEVTLVFRNALKEPSIIPMGTEMHTWDNLEERVYFKTIQNVRVPKGSLRVTVKVEANEPGTKGNVEVGDIAKLTIGRANIDFIFNEQPFTNGLDRETDKKREERFQKYVHSLQRGTRDALLYCILNVPGVRGAIIDDQYIGFVRCFVHDSEGNLNEDLKAKIEQALVNYRSAGIEVIILPIIKLKTDIHVRIKYKEHVDGRIYNAQIEKLITQYLKHLPGSESLNKSKITTIIHNNYEEIIGHIDFVDFEDIKTQTNEIITPGFIEVETIE